jgi:murein L,D-transpeptidase YafK
MGGTKAMIMRNEAKQFRPMFSGSFPRALRLGAIAGLLSVLSACTSVDFEGLSAGPPLSAKTIAQLKSKGMTKDSSVLVRIFKQESELEVWKINSSGHYALFKSYPMCRWSGKLGPKLREGDRQAPEGFYHVSATMLNPKSQFNLSFNLGFPNRLEAAQGFTGDALMVHGACSSSGCFAMTDAQIEEIYPIVREALAGGQSRFQVQSYPFRMTAKNLAVHKDSPHFAFWRTLKEGYDIFETTKREPKVSTCDRRYQFNMEFAGGEPKQPLAACPPATSLNDPSVASKLQDEQNRLIAMLAEGTPAPALSYVDGGMHPSFRTLLQQGGAKMLAAKVSKTKYPISRPDAALADPFSSVRSEANEDVN